MREKNNWRNISPIISSGAEPFRGSVDPQFCFPPSSYAGNVVKERNDLCFVVLTVLFYRFGLCLRVVSYLRAVTLAAKGRHECVAAGFYFGRRVRVRRVTKRKKKIIVLYNTLGRWPR